MSRYKTLYNNTLIFTVSNFASKILTFLMLPLYTRVLSREDFGSADLVTMTVGLLIPLLTISIADSILRFTLDENENKNVVFSFGLKITSGSILILLFLYPLFRLIPVINNYLLFFYLIFISQSVNLLLNQFARGINKIKLIGIVGFAQTFSIVLCNIILLVIFDFGVIGFLISIIISNFIGIILLFTIGNMRKYILFEKNDPLFIKRMLSFSIPLIPNSVSWWINNSSNRYIISAYSGVSELGLFSAASRIPSMLSIFQGIFVQAWQLSAITEFNKSDSVVFFSQIYKYYNFFMVISCSFLITILKPLSHFMFGSEFENSWVLVPFLLISIIFGALNGFLGQINIAVKKTKSLFVTSLLGAIISISLNLIFVPKYGAIAASITALISYIIIWIVRLLDVRKYIKLEISYIKDSISYLLLITQSIIIILSNSTKNILVSIIFLFIIMSLNYKTLFYSVNFLKDKFLKI